VIRVDAVWLSTEPLDMRSGTESALTRVVNVFGAARPHHAYLFARPLDFVSLAALSDSFFPRIFLRRHKYVAIGTVSLTTYFHVDSSELREQGDRHVFGNVRAVNYRNGYFDQSAEIWSADAQLLASTHQLVYYRE
jgi:hypothetical protein